MNIVICDDERQIAEKLKEKAENLVSFASVIIFSSGDELLRSGCKPDICFLDIQMPGTNGMETARLLRKKYPDTILIFVSGIEEYVFQAFDVGAFHYLLKPFSDEKFAEILSRATEEFEKNSGMKAGSERTIMINRNGIHRKIILDNIIFAEVYNRIVLIHEKNEDTEYYGKLSELELVAGNSFFRSHRSYLVNLKYVEKYDSTHIWLTRGEALIAKAKYPMFVKAFLKYNKRG